MSARSSEHLPPIYAWFVRLMLRPWLTRSERDDVMLDVADLRAAYRAYRGNRGIACYTWRQLLQYPARLAAARRHDRHFPVDSGVNMSGLLSDFRTATRTLRRSSLLSASVIAILALAICANATIYSVVHAVLIAPLPYPDPDRVVTVWTTTAAGSRLRLAPGTLIDTRELDVFTELGAFQGTDTTLTPVDGSPENLSGARVTAGYFETFNREPVLGRIFAASDFERGERPMVIIAHDLWTRRFGGDPRIVGQPATLNDTPFEIVGVMPPGEYPTEATVAATMPLLPGGPDFWVPIRFGEEFYGNRGAKILGVIGRLREGVTFEAAAEAVRARGSTLAVRDELPGATGLVLTSFRTEAVGSVERALTILMLTVGAVLLIAATNVAALLLGRAESRQGELAVRAALGAGRWPLLRLQLVETFLLAAAGGALGLAATPQAIHLLRTQIPTQIPRILSAETNGAVLGFSAILVVTVTLLAGLVPAIFATRRDLLVALRQATASRGIDPGRRRLQSGMVVAQTALAVVLLIASSLLARSFLELSRVDMGFDEANVLAINLNAPRSVSGDFPSMVAFWSQAHDRLATIPGVAAVGFGSDTPVERNWLDGFLLEGMTEDDTVAKPQASIRALTPGYMEALDVPILEGRGIGTDDRADSAPVVVINAALARAHFGDRDPIGQRIRIPSFEQISGVTIASVREIVGVVGDIRHLGPTVPAEPSIYMPLDQFPRSSVVALVRQDTSRPDVAAAVQRNLAEIDPALSLEGPQNLRILVSRFTARDRFAAILVGLFGFVGLTLSAVGTYALVARTVGLRLREYGLRLAVGAPATALIADVVRTAFTPAAIGAAIGIVIAGPLANAMRGQLFGIGPFDPLSYAAAPLVLAASAMLAAALCARRALAVDPVIALRSD